MREEGGRDTPFLAESATSNRRRKGEVRV